MIQSEKLTRLTSEPIGRLLWQYSLPAVVGMLVMSLYNVVDRIFIGQVVGPEAIAGMTITFPVMNITTAVGVLVGVGSSTRASIVLGAGNLKRAELILGNAFTLTWVFAATYIAIFATWIEPILYAFGAGNAALPYARQYMVWVLPGLFFTNLAFSLNNMMRASGYPNQAMATMIIGAVTNVCLDAVFVLWLDWGMFGAALATDIAMLASAVFVLRHLCNRKHTLHFRRGTFKPQWGVMRNIFAIGIAPAVINAASCLINAIINQSLAATGSDMSIGAAGIFVTYTSLIVTFILGISTGLQPIIGYNFGAGRLDRLTRGLKLATGVSTVICVAGSVVGLCLPQYVAMMFTSDEVLISTTVHCLRTALWAFGVVGFQIIATTFFQSTGAPGKAFVASLARQVIFMIPFLLWFSSPWGLNLGVDGVWMSFPISDLCATVVISAMLLTQLRKIRDARRQ